MLDLRVAPRSELANLNVGDKFIDEDGNEQVVTEIRSESGAVTIVSHTVTAQ